MAIKVERCGLLGLQQRRKNAGYTQQQLSDAIGVERSTYANWEAGWVWPSAAYLPPIADLLLCSIDDLYHPMVTEEEAPDNGA